MGGTVLEGDDSQTREHRQPRLRETAGPLDTNISTKTRWGERRKQGKLSGCRHADRPATGESLWRQVADAPEDRDNQSQPQRQVRHPSTRTVSAASRSQAGTPLQLPTRDSVWAPSGRHKRDDDDVTYADLATKPRAPTHPVALSHNSAGGPRHCRRAQDNGKWTPGHAERGRTSRQLSGPRRPGRGLGLQSRPLPSAPLASPENAILQENVRQEPTPTRVSWPSTHNHADLHSPPRAGDGPAENPHQPGAEPPHT